MNHQAPMEPVLSNKLEEVMATSMSPVDITRLKEICGIRITAVIADTTQGGDIASWISGALTPSDRQIANLTFALNVTERILSEYDSDTVRAFLRSNNPYLNESPALAIRDGKHDEVDIAVNQFLGA